MRNYKIYHYIGVFGHIKFVKYKKVRFLTKNGFNDDRIMDSFTIFAPDKIFVKLKH